MKVFTTKQILEIIHGKLIKGDENALIHYILADIEYLKSNSLLFLDTKQFNHKHLEVSIPFVVVTSEIDEVMIKNKFCTVLLVENVKKEYKRFIYYLRCLFNIPIVSFIGNGQRIHRMVQYVVEEEFKIPFLENKPFEFHKIDESTELALVDFNTLDELLIQYYSPYIGIINENHKGLSNKLIPLIEDKGTLILNMDELDVKNLNLDHCQGKIKTIGIKEDALYRAIDIHIKDSTTTFKLKYHRLEIPMYIAGTDKGCVYDSLMTISLLHHLGFNLPDIIEKLKTYR